MRLDLSIGVGVVLATVVSSILAVPLPQPGVVASLIEDLGFRDDVEELIPGSSALFTESDEEDHELEQGAHERPEAAGDGHVATHDHGESSRRSPAPMHSSSKGILSPSSSSSASFSRDRNHVAQPADLSWHQNWVQVETASETVRESYPQDEAVRMSKLRDNGKPMTPLPGQSRMTVGMPRGPAPNGECLLSNIVSSTKVG